MICSLYAPLTLDYKILEKKMFVYKINNKVLQWFVHYMHP